MHKNNITHESVTIHCSEAIEKKTYIIICKRTPKMKTIYEVFVHYKYRNTVQNHTSKQKKTHQVNIGSHRFQFLVKHVHAMLKTMVCNPCMILFFFYRLEYTCSEVNSMKSFTDLYTNIYSSCKYMR